MGEFILIYTIICAITFAFIVLNKYINNKSKFILAKKIIAEKDIHNSDPEQMFNLLDYLIQTEMSYLIELPFEGRDIKRITNFEDLGCLSFNNSFEYVISFPKGLILLSAIHVLSFLENL